MQKQKKILNIALIIIFFEQRGIHIKKFKNFEALSIGLVVVVYVFNFAYFVFGKGWVEFGYIVFGLNGAQWVFS